MNDTPKSGAAVAPLSASPGSVEASLPPAAVPDTSDDWEYRDRQAMYALWHEHMRERGKA